MRFGNNIVLVQPELTKPESCTQLFKNISNPYVVAKAGEAIFLLNYIISECLSNNADCSKVVLKNVASEYGVSKQTLSLWLKRLIKEGLIQKVSVNSYTHLKPVYFLNPFLIVTYNAYKSLTNNNHLVICDILTRLEKLESESIAAKGA